MSDQRFIAIGDIHGCLKSLEAILEKLKPYYNRQFVFVGDYIDRGPNSKEVVDFLLDFRQDVDCVFLRGNHEQMLLDAIKNNKMHMWVMNGGKSTINSYGNSNSLQLSEEHRSFYEQTRFYYDTENYFFVHAGISPGKTIAQSINNNNEIEEFLWERSHLNAFETPWEKTVVFGHTPQPHPLKKDNMIGIDTGCVYDRGGYGRLTAVKLPEEEFVEQVCLDR